MKMKTRQRRSGASAARPPADVLPDAATVLAPEIHPPVAEREEAPAPGKEDSPSAEANPLPVPDNQQEGTGQPQPLEIASPGDQKEAPEVGETPEAKGDTPGQPDPVPFLGDPVGEGHSPVEDLQEVPEHQPGDPAPLPEQPGPDLMGEPVAFVGSEGPADEAFPAEFIPEGETEPLSPVLPDSFRFPMAGEGVDAIVPEDGESDGELPEAPQYKSIPILETLIDFSPLGGREEVDEDDVLAMAKNMRELKYVIAPVTVRVVVEGRYELVVGEIRVRAARLAGIVYIPAVIRQVSDDVAREMQIAENHHRKDPHIMAEARKVARLVGEQRHKSVPEVARRLGMSATAAYTRYALANLSPDFERLYRATILDTKEALAVATLSRESQAALFENHGKNWETRKTTAPAIVANVVSRYRCDLSEALFDTADGQLVPGATACKDCGSNLSNELNQSLFKDANLLNRCSNSQCFDEKTWVTFTRNLGEAIREYSVSAIVVEGGPSKTLEDALPTIPGASELKRFDSAEVFIVTSPVEPTLEYYLAIYASAAEGNEAYELALAGYNDKRSALESDLENGHVISGVLIDDFYISPVLFRMIAEPEANASEQPEPNAETEVPEKAVVAKMTTNQIREAVDRKVVDVDALKREINTIEVGQSSLERDDKTNSARTIAQTFREKTHVDCKSKKFKATTADRCGTFLLLYDALSYKCRPYANEYLFGKHTQDVKTEQVIKRAHKCTPEDIACLTRLGFAYNDQYKNPSQAQFSLLREIAQGSGVNVKKIEADTEATAEKRRKRNAIRIAEIKKTIAQAEAKTKPKEQTPKVKVQPPKKGLTKPAAKPVSRKPAAKSASKAAVRRRGKAAPAKRAKTV